jgi:UDP-N-acetyl-D-mannosaminuronate dehydrogenase
MKTIIKKNVVVGLGEIGSPISKLLEKKSLVVGYDLDKKLMDLKKFKKLENIDTLFLHVCIPHTKNFKKNVLQLIKKFKPEIVVIHSTISPNTTYSLQSVCDIPIMYSATRGVHKRMLTDLKRYTKYFAISKNAPKKKMAITEFKKSMKLCNVKTKQMEKPETLELAKIICDTSYLGWLINYAQLSNMIAIQYNVNYDEMWSFSDEIHELLGNRPKLYPGFIGGHCVIPNLDLMHNQTLDLIKKINSKYEKKVKNAKSIHKKYTK